MRRNVENKNNSINITFVARTSDIRHFFEKIRSDVLSEVATPTAVSSLTRTAVELFMFSTMTFLSVYPIFRDL